MNAPLLQGKYTPDDLLEVDERGFELLDGHLVEKPMGARAARVGNSLNRLVGNFVDAGQLGHPLDSDCGYELFPARARVRKPDVSVVLKGRLPDEILPDGWLRIAPDFAAEVVSPNDKADEVMTKVIEWLAVGVRLLWIVYPASRTVLVLRPGGGAVWLGPEGMLSGEDVLPGFTCPVDELFAGLPPRA